MQKTWETFVFKNSCDWIPSALVQVVAIIENSLNNNMILYKSPEASDLFFINKAKDDMEEKRALNGFVTYGS